MSQDESRGGQWPQDWEHNKPLAPIVVSILAIVGWLVFILLYALYWSNGFSVFQNIIVTIVSLVIVALLIGLGWVVWGMRHAKVWKDWTLKPESK
jgi:high-affinity Fe2+/Pb2+ permease